MKAWQRARGPGLHRVKPRLPSSAHVGAGAKSASALLLTAAAHHCERASAVEQPQSWPFIAFSDSSASNRASTRAGCPVGDLDLYGPARGEVAAAVVRAPSAVGLPADGEQDDVDRPLGGREDGVVRGHDAVGARGQVLRVLPCLLPEGCVHMDADPA